MKKLSTVVLSLVLLSFNLQVQATTFTVTTTNANGAGSLEQAIIDANADASAGPHIIDMDAIAGGTINRNAQYTIQSAVIIEPSSLVTINFGGTATGVFDISGANTAGTTIGNLALGNNGNGNGFQISNTSNITVRNCFIGVFEDGTSMGTPSVGNGVYVFGTSSDIFIQDTEIGGAASNGIQVSNGTVSDIEIIGCTVHGCEGNGIYLESNQVYAVTIQGCIVGLDRTGTARDGNGGHGIYVVNGPSNITIGGTDPSERNVIGDNSIHGIFLEELVDEVDIIGNYMGTDITGEVNLGNDHNGIGISRTSNVKVRDNLISGNGYNPDNSGAVDCNGYKAIYSGIGIQVASSNIEITGNIIGLDKDGVQAIPNSNYGIWAGSFVTDDVQNVTIGGLTDDLRNVISSNGTSLPQTVIDGGCFLGHGIFMERELNNLNILNNYIGTDITGTVDMGNRGHGLAVLSSTDVTIGGSADGANVLSGNTLNGVFIGDNGNISRNNVNVTVSHNFVGVLEDGTTAMGNDENGIGLDGQTDVQVNENIVTSNGHVGISLNNTGSSTITNNMIGVGQDGTTDLGNVMGGVRIAASGGTSVGNTVSLNTIAYSTGAATDANVGNGYGVYVGGTSANENYIDENLIYCNADLNISLVQDGSSFGTIGAGNDDQQTPTIDPAISTRDITYGTGAPGDEVQVFTNDPNCGCGGKVYLGSANVAGDGTWSFDHTGNLVLAGDSNLVAVTGTDGDNNTSQFTCKTAIAGTPNITATSVCEGEPAELTLTNHDAAILVWQIATDNGFTNIIFEDTTDAIAEPFIRDYDAPNDGTFYVRVISVVDVGNTATSNVADFTINPVPTFTSITADSPICEGDPTDVALTGSNGTVAWYSSTDGTSFSVVAGQTGTSISPSPTPSETTWYTATLTSAVGSCETNTDTVQVVVNPIVQGEVTVEADTNDICAGGPLTFTANATNVGSGAILQWSVDGDVQSETSSVFTATDLVDGDEVTVVVKADTVCPVSPTVEDDFILSLPSYASVSADDTICDGESASVNVVGAIGTIQWYSSTDGVSFDPVVGQDGAAISPDPTPSETTLFAAVLSSEYGSCEVNSDTISITVNPIIQGEVSISVDTNDVCQGVDQIFTANAIGVGSNASYQWQLNGSDVGAGTNLFATSGLSKGDEVTVTVMVDTVCPVSPTVSSIAPFEVVVEDTVTPSFDINGDDVLCSGDLGTFTSLNIENGGDDPQFEWFVNGVSTFIGDTLQLTTLEDSDSVQAVMTSNARCLTQETAASNIIIIQNVAVNTPEITIGIDTNDVCPGQAMIFTAAISAGGNSPTIVWYQNDQAVGNGSSLELTSYNEGDTVWASLTSSGTCLSVNGDSSMAIEILTLDPTTPSVTLTTDDPSACEGNTINFEASASDVGSSPVYTWMVNGEVVLGNGAQASFDFLEDGDEVTVMVDASDEVCVDPQSATSNAIVAEVITRVTPAIEIAHDQGVICDQATVTFDTVSTENLGDATFSYFINDEFVTNQTSFTVDTLKDGDVVSIVAISTLECVTSSEAQDAVTISIQELTELTLSVGPSTNNACVEEDEDILFTTSSNVAGSAQYEWILNGSAVSGETGDSFLHTDAQSGDQVAVSLTTDQECVEESTVASSVVTLNFSHPVEAVTGGDITLQDAEVIDVDGTGSTEDASYQWFKVVDGDTTFLTNELITENEVSSLESEFYLIVSNDNCADTASFIATIDFDIHIPNVYSPNGDNNHDVWMITNIDKFPDVEVEIYNRWGSLLFKTNRGDGYSLDNAWDGTFEGTEVPDATYYYILKISDEIDPFSGSVTIIR